MLAKLVFKPILLIHESSLCCLCTRLLSPLIHTSERRCFLESGLVLQAARHQPSLRATFHGLVDLLVAWWLEPKLDDIVRSVFSHLLPAGIIIDTELAASVKPTETNARLSPIYVSYAA